MDKNLIDSIEKFLLAIFELTKNNNSIISSKTCCGGYKSE